VYKQLLFSTVLITVLAISAAAQSSYRYWSMVNMNMMNNTMTAALIAGNCAEIKAAGRPLPENCCQYKRHGNSVGAWTTWNGSCGDSTSGSNTEIVPKKSANPNATSKFTPVSDDDSIQKFVDSVGTTEDEKALMLQIAASTKAAFEQQYAAKGWKNNIAGAFTFFILTTSMVYNDSEPNEATQDILFKTLDQVIGSDNGISSASNKDKTGLYNSLIAYGGLPLTFYVHGKQTGNSSEVAQAKQLAGGFIKMILQTEPESLSALVKADAANASTNGTSASVTKNSDGEFGSADARYSCMKLVYRNGASVYDPAGLGFTIKGNSYSVVSGTGGKVAVNGDVVSFSGGRLNGYRGEMRTNSTRLYIFFRTKFTEIRRNESIKFGDIQCYKQ
jgi:hypothetical protein